MALSWKKLTSQINQLTEEQQETDVTILISNEGEVYQVKAFGVLDPEDDISDVLDPNHPVLYL